MHLAFWLCWGNLRERDHSVDLHGRIILKRIFKKWEMGCRNMDWIDLAQERDR